MASPRKESSGARKLAKELHERDRKSVTRHSLRKRCESVYNHCELVHTLDLDDKYLEFLHLIRESGAKVNNNKYYPRKPTLWSRKLRESKSTG